MQRCCIPTLFSHLWWRLILQALQRRPCFAVFPARNTTCLAVVPETHGKKGKQVHIHVRSWSWIHSGLNCNLLQKKGWRKWKVLFRITSPVEQFTKCDTGYTLLWDRLDQSECNWAISNTWNWSKPLQMCSSSWLFISMMVSTAAAGINLDSSDWLVKPQVTQRCKRRKISASAGVWKKKTWGEICGHRIKAVEADQRGETGDSWTVMWSLGDVHNVKKQWSTCSQYWCIDWHSGNYSVTAPVLAAVCQLRSGSLLINQRSRETGNRIYWVTVERILKDKKHILCLGQVWSRLGDFQ